MTNKLGRPVLSKDDKTVNLSVSVTKAQARFLKDHGFGNVSLGIRRLVDEKRLIGVALDPQYCAIAEDRLLQGEDPDA